MGGVNRDTAAELMNQRPLPPAEAARGPGAAGASGRLCVATVAQGRTILAEYVAPGFSRHRAVTKGMLDRMVYANPQEGARLRMEQQGLTFSGMVHGGHLYLLTAERAAGVELPMAALQRCIAEAAGMVVHGKAPRALSLNATVGPIFKAALDTCERNPHQHSKVEHMKSELNEIKVVMHDNIEKILDRGERLQDISDKTQQLQMTAMEFHKQSRRVRKQMWCLNCKAQAMISALVLGVGGVVALVVWLSIRRRTVHVETS